MNLPWFSDLRVAAALGLGGAILQFPPLVLAQRPIGIDVSNYQGSGINWTSVKASGVTFAWAKATQGTGFIDADFTINEANAKAAGVYIGAYHFAQPAENPGLAGADAEAAHFWSVAKNYIKGTNMYLMPMLDIEEAVTTNQYSKTTLSQWVNRWCQDIVNYASASNVTVHPVVYTYISYSSTWLDSTVTQWRLWMANYNGQSPQTGAPNGTSPWSTWTAWQYSSSGAVPGVTGNCDQDVFNGTAATFVTTLVIGGGTNAPTIVTPPQNLALALGAMATFNVNATGVGPLHFQWMFNQANIPGATATNYTIPNVQLADAGGYSVAISNVGGATISSPAFLSVFSQLTNATSCIAGPPNMVNWWPAEGNQNDIFSTNHGTPHGGFAYAVGKQGWAFHFDGFSGYLTTGAASVAAPWTACMWVNRQNAPGPGAALLSDGNNELKLEQYNGTRQVGVTQFGKADSSFGYIAPAGVWTHLAFVGAATGTALYVNGVLQSTLTNTIPLPRGYIGAGYAASSGNIVDFMMGSLDEILMFNRALTASEISSIFAAGSAGLVRVPEFTGLAPMGNGEMQLNLRGQTSKTFSIYSSPDLSAWSRLGTISNPTGSIQYLDNIATNGQAFYRASQP